MSVHNVERMLAGAVVWQVSSIWTMQRCGDGKCDLPYEFKGYGTLGCQSDCGLELDLHPVVVVLQADFRWSTLGSDQARNLASSVRWNLCKADSERKDAGLDDLCWYPEDQALPDTNYLAETTRFYIPRGEWYIRVEGDYYHLMRGRVMDAHNNTKLNELTVYPAWISCEVSFGILKKCWEKPNVSHI